MIHHPNVWDSRTPGREMFSFFCLAGNRMNFTCMPGFRFQDLEGASKYSSYGLWQQTERNLMFWQFQHALSKIPRCSQLKNAVRCCINSYQRSFCLYLHPCQLTLGLIGMFYNCRFNRSIIIRFIFCFQPCPDLDIVFVFLPMSVFHS